MHSTDLCSPVLWHPDLHRSNIFVPDHAPHNLIGLIDWQNSGVSPFFTRKMLPKAFAYDHGRVQITPGVIGPPLPSNFEELSEEEKKLFRDDQFDAGMRTIYEAVMKRNSPQHMFHTQLDAKFLVEPFHAYTCTWAHGLDKMQYFLARLEHEWEALAPPGTNCPLHFFGEGYRANPFDC